jgi:hypothetical protein
MGNRTMKQDLFTIKALESKGYDMADILSMSDEELDALPISTKLIEGAKLYKLRGGVSADVIAEQIADMMMREEPAQVKPEVIQEYQAVPETEVQVIEAATPVLSDEEVQALEEVEIIRTESNADDVQIIKESLQRKEAKTFQPFIKHLKTEVPEAILDSVDSTLVAELIEARIAEVKAAQEKTK